ncbi:hypothetical protein [Zooshikella sp. RANM57]|uniref:hypothetical protein n=1 Tax=Zooshikella sp. RANM57 TaxID=3425863 RepID=UPI003D6EA02F
MLINSLWQFAVSEPSFSLFILGSIYLLLSIVLIINVYFRKHSAKHALVYSDIQQLPLKPYSAAPQYIWTQLFQTVSIFSLIMAGASYTSALILYL